MSRRLLIVCCLLLLLIACGLQQMVAQYFAYGTTTGRSANQFMRRTLEGEVNGWQMKDQPLGPTEATEGDVQRVLNFDDCFSAAYFRGNHTFTVFVSYWRPDKMPSNLVASHTPDRCWVSAGWLCDKYDLRESLQLGGIKLQPAYWRVFHLKDGPPQHVLYWHLVGGRAQVYGGNTLNSVIPWYYWWRTATVFGFQGTDEQYFIRVVSSRPFEEIWPDPGFQEVMRRLTSLGLRMK